MAINNENEYERTLKYIGQIESSIDKKRRLLRNKGMPPDQINNILEPALTFVQGMKEEAEAYRKSHPKN